MDDEAEFPNSFLNVSAEANSWGSMMRQPTELAVLLAGIGIVVPLANWGKANTCDAIDEDGVNDANDEGMS